MNVIECVDFVMNVFHLIQDQSSQMATRAGDQRSQMATRAGDQRSQMATRAGDQSSQMATRAGDQSSQMATRAGDQVSKKATRVGWVIAAIDFGTTYSGYAFSFTNELTSDSTRQVKP